MATISTDGQSFILNSRRLWIVGGEIGYAGVPRSLWRARFKAAARAGFNTAFVPVIWAAHERVKGTFDFDGDNDLAEFCRLAGQEGLWVVLRAGPVSDGHFSMGGMPAHLLGSLDEGERLRTGDASFLSAVSSFYSAFAKQIAPLQATRAGEGEADPRRAGHPLLAVQTEHRWTCGEAELARTYLDALTRYLREGRVTVPVLNLNNMYAEGEGAIETWSGYASLHAITRQLRTAWPDDPAIIGSLLATTQDVWGEKRQDHKTPASVQRAIAEVLGAAGQFCVADAAPSAPRGFAPGRLSHATSAWTAAAPPRDIIAEDGSTGPAYSAVRRICTFASSFAGVFASAEIDAASVGLSASANARAVIDERTGERDGAKPVAPGYAVHEVRGTAGAVAFVLADPNATGKRPPAVITLPTGLELRAELGKLPVAWVLLDAHLHSNQRLDYATFNVFARAGDALVLFGSAGAQGAVSINGSSLTLTVPAGKSPVVERLDGTTVILCNEQQIDGTIIGGDAVYVGAESVERSTPGDAGENGETASETVHPAPGFKNVLKVERGGGVRTLKPGPRGGGKPRVALADWSFAASTPQVEGTSDRFARFDGPATLESVGTPHGYAWLRTTIKAAQAKRSAKLGFFELADRALVSVNGSEPEVVGLGPGAPGMILSANLAKGEQTLTLLLDNLGRFAEGFDMAEPKGLYGHVYRVEPVKAKAERVTATPINLLANAAPLEGIVTGDTTHAERLSWSFAHRRKTPVIFHVAEPNWTGLVLLNGEPIARLIPGRPISVAMTNEQLKRGNNEVQLAVAGDDAYIEREFALIKKTTALYEGCEALTDGAPFAMAAWEPPADKAFEPVAKAGLAGTGAKSRRGTPGWWRCSFTAPAEPIQLCVSLAGMSKGQLLVNGHNVCRYWVATADGKPVPPQDVYALPQDVVRYGEENELMLFDEHGCSPAKAAIKCGPLNG